MTSEALIQHRIIGGAAQLPGAIGLPAVLALLSGATPALAHAVESTSDGFAIGFLHPLTGFDHLLAMVSVGIWGAELGPPAIWLLPIAFPLMMALGGMLGVIGVPLPGTELLIALSVVILGTMVALAQRAPLRLALVVIGAFAIAHGHAHGVELPDTGDALAFTVGFVLATGFLHAVGIVIGLGARWPGVLLAIRIGGALVTAAGCYFIYGYAGA
jgi:urease accessory protein